MRSHSQFLSAYRVLAISTGIDATVVTKPLIILAVKCMKIPSWKYPLCTNSLLACEYDDSCAALTTAALPMVGMQPRQRVSKPSSRVILTSALMTEV